MSIAPAAAALAAMAWWRHRCAIAAAVASMAWVLRGRAAGNY